MGFFYDTIAVYSSNKLVKIRSIPLKVLYLFLVLGLFLFLVIYVLVFQHGAQKTVVLISSTMVKVKGIGSFKNGSAPLEIWDAVDVVSPALEDGAVFLTTGFARVIQTRSNCSGLKPCSNASDCEAQYIPVDSGGIQTGVCESGGFCEVQAWCPVEDPTEADRPALLDGIPDFSIFVRNSVGFPQANDGFDTGSDLVRGWNFFYLSDLLKNASVDFESIRATGAVMALSYDYDCNLDRKAERCKAKAKTSVVRLGQGKDADTTTGFNFRREDLFERYDNVTDSNQSARLLMKLYGIRLVVLVSGVGRVFDFKNMATNIGSGLGMITLAAAIVEFIMTMFWPTKDLINRILYDDPMATPTPTPGP